MLSNLNESSSPRDVRKLSRSFYRRPAEELAHELIGKVLVRRVGSMEMHARIVETEAYVGQHDLACHASKGRTGRTEIMFGPAGFAYVYLIYGMHDMFNIVSGAVNDGQAVLIRAAEPLDGLNLNLSGPGKLTRALQITRADNGIDLTGESLFLMDDNAPRPRIIRTPRIGVDYAAEWKDEPLRFLDADSRAVSKGRAFPVPPGLVVPSRLAAPLAGRGALRRPDKPSATVSVTDHKGERSEPSREPEERSAPRKRGR
jgi:DNA-3-methyladenine glycosylase